ncbi:substrate-binding periplasmic protein [Dongshaea marina]|uniref:substrate-binding periplasmic protein n=1 Tax=Dongshaea marina TaxID=2047966 RepID=UPI000D3EDC63|nr:transporter substrate-binding domain-containing protein [Dongshaea marina]
MRLIVIALMMAVVSLSSAADKRVELSVGEFPPYISDSLPEKGILAELVTQAFGYSGYQTEYQFYPWKRAFHLARGGVSNGSLMWMKSKKRENSFYFSSPVFYLNQNFFYLKSRFPNGFEWNSMKDLDQYHIGGTLGYFYGKEFEQAEKELLIHVHRKSSDSINFMRLLEEKIDLFPIELCAGYALLRKLYPDKLQLFAHSSEPINSSPRYAIFPKLRSDSLELLKALNHGLSKVDLTKAQTRLYLSCIPEE